jgi:polyisoprenoid-binding protein YceI
MRLIALLLAGGLLVQTASGAEVKYNLTGTNTKLEFTGSKPSGEKHEGGFKKLKGSLVVAEDQSLKLDVEIDTRSLFADVPKLTNHLKSADFFSVKDHPTATFKSSAIEKDGDGYKVTGDLTLLGKTKEVSFPAKIDAADKLTLTADLTIKRLEFGMNYGKGDINDEVAIRVKVDARKSAR